jgi:hypothetical protein
VARLTRRAHQRGTVVLDALVALLITVTVLGAALAAIGGAARHAAAAYDRALHAAGELAAAEAAVPGRLAGR